MSSPIILIKIIMIKNLEVMQLNFQYTLVKFLWSLNIM